MIHRKIYEHCYGSIPIDENGRSYDVHHIDGNHANNHPTNLEALHIQKHYNRHWQQGDYYAAYMIKLRMNCSLEELAETSRQVALERAKNGTHPSQIRSKNGTHNWFGKSNPTYKRSADGTQSLIAKRSNEIRIRNGTHPFLSGEVQRRYQLNAPVVTCPVCGKEGKGSAMKRWHFDRCKHV